jgi:NAD(P)-dependent dehydrogenase (short-subunit alcohol dehydrogenase family)
MRFAGKVAVITGGSGGLGRSFAGVLAEEGAHIAILDVDETAAFDTASALTQRGFEALGAVCDVTDERDVDQTTQQVRDRFGRIDILINSAALHRRKYNQPFGSLPRDEVRALFDVNVMGIINCSLAAQPTMAAGGGGVIVNIASTSGNTVRTPYGVSKLAARGVTTALAAEFAGDNIRVNAISPGFIGPTAPLAERAPKDLMPLLAAIGSTVPTEVLSKCSSEDLVRIVRSLQLVQRDGTVDDIVQAMLYLCSDAAGFVTGETLKIAGGAAIGF